jgi:hypothetical protein
VRIRGAEHLTPEQLVGVIGAGGRLVLFEYCVSLLVVTLRCPTDVYLLRPGQYGAILSLPYTLLTFALGWWGVPWGFVYTPLVLVNNLSGGSDVTAEVVPAILSQTGLVHPDNSAP